MKEVLYPLSVWLTVYLCLLAINHLFKTFLPSAKPISRITITSLLLVPLMLYFFIPNIREVLFSNEELITKENCTKHSESEAAKEIFKI